MIEVRVSNVYLVLFAMMNRMKGGLIAVIRLAGDRSALATAWP